MQKKRFRYGVLTNYNVFLVFVCVTATEYDILPPVYRARRDGAHDVAHRAWARRAGVRDEVAEALSTPLGILLAISLLPSEQYVLDGAQGEEEADEGFDESGDEDATMEPDQVGFISLSFILPFVISSFCPFHSAFAGW